MRKTSRSKYGAIPTTVDGYRFASKREAERYGELKLLEKAGEIHGVGVHPRYPLMVLSPIDGKLYKVGTYVADFTYWEKDGLVIEDVKSRPTMTSIYRLKKKLMKVLYGVEIMETE